MIYLIKQPIKELFLTAFSLLMHCSLLAKKDKITSSFYQQSHTHTNTHTQAFHKHWHWLVSNNSPSATNGQKSVCCVRAPTDLQAQQYGDKNPELLIPCLLCYQSNWHHRVWNYLTCLFAQNWAIYHDCHGPHEINNWEGNVGGIKRKTNNKTRLLHLSLIIFVFS